MTSTQATPGADVFAPPRPSRWLARGDDALFVALAVVAALVVFLAFGLEFIGAPPPHARPHTGLVIAHAAAFVTWIGLFGVQVALIASHRPRVHRRAGVAAAVLAVIMLVLGSAVAIHAARTGYAPVPGLGSLGFLIVPLGDLVVFAVLVGAGIYWRQASDIHKRLMWFATASLTFPAVTRIPHVRGHILLIYLVFFAILAIVPVYERVVLGRVHRVSALLGAAVFLSVPLRGLIGRTAWWHAAAARLIGG